MVYPAPAFTWEEQGIEKGRVWGREHLTTDVVKSDHVA